MEVESRERMKKIHAKPINIWEDFFKDKTHGGHRYSTEEFLAMEAREPMWHCST